MTWAEFFSSALIPIVLLFLGLYGLTAGKKAGAVRPKFKLGFIDVPSLQVSPPWNWVVNLLGVILIAISLYLFIGDNNKDDTQETPVEGVSLISVSYEYEDWNPRIVDLRTAHESGIPVSPGHSLKLFDLYVDVPDEITNYVVLAAIYGNDELIGLTEGKRLVPGINNLNDIEIKNYHHDTVENAWRVQDGWESISIVLMYYIGENKIGSTSNTILLNPAGESWYITSPYTSIVSLSYRINAGPEFVADLRTIIEDGIAVKEGDSLAITEVWYQSDTGSDETTIQFEAYLSSGGYDLQTLQISDKNTVEAGVHEILNGKEIQWMVGGEQKYLVMTLARDGKTIMDRITVPFASPGATHLLLDQGVVQWPFDSAAYYDFEDQEELAGWSSYENNLLSITDDLAFSGFHAMTITTVNTQSQQFAAFKKNFKASLIVGQVYWPGREDVRVEWAQACIIGSGICAPISQQPDHWNPFVINLNQLTNDEDEPLSQFEMSGIYLQGWVDGPSQTTPYNFYVDSIQIYPSASE